MVRSQPKTAPSKSIDEPKSIDSYISMALGLIVVIIVGLLAYNFSTKKTNQSNLMTTTENPTALNTTGEAGMSAKTHTVKSGETLWSIAETYYKSGYNWVDLQKANNLTNSNSITVGQVLKIPDVAPIQVGQISATSTEQLQPKDSEYTVKLGDTLWSISLKEYGTGYKWADIAKANQLSNPNLIHKGNRLKLP